MKPGGPEATDTGSTLQAWCEKQGRVLCASKVLSLTEFWIKYLYTDETCFT